MKNVLKLVLLVALFISTSSDVFSQTITNNTNCDFNVNVFFSYPPDCDNSDNINYPVAARTSATITPPTGASVSAANGAPTSNTICRFRVAACGGGSPIDVVSCGSGGVSGGSCNSYTVIIDPATGDITINP